MLYPPGRDDVCVYFCVDVIKETAWDHSECRTFWALESANDTTLNDQPLCEELNSAQSVSSGAISVFVVFILYILMSI